MRVSEPLSSIDQETVGEYLLNLFSAFRLGAWRHDQFRAEIESTLCRALCGDAGVYAHMERVIPALSLELSRRFGDADFPEELPLPASQWSGQPGETRSLDLAKVSDARGHAGTSIHLLADGTIRIGRHDHGPASDAALGGDNERWVEVPGRYTPAIAFVLLAEQLQGRLDAIDWLDFFSTRWGVPAVTGKG